MFKKDNVFIGVALGLLLPGIAWYFVEILKKNVRFFEKDDLLYIGCIALNLIAVRFLFKYDKENTARGIVASTFVCALIFFFYKVRQ